MSAQLFSLLGAWTRIGEGAWVGGSLVKKPRICRLKRSLQSFLLQDSFNILVSLNFLAGGCRLPGLFWFYPGTLAVSQNKTSQQFKGTSPMWWEPCERSQVNRASSLTWTEQQNTKPFSMCESCKRLLSTLIQPIFLGAYYVSGTDWVAISFSKNFCGMRQELKVAVRPKSASFTYGLYDLEKIPSKD